MKWCVPSGPLLGDEDPELAILRFARWRRRHGHAILILDHFEELFTQNPPDLQQSFAELVAALPLAADVHVLMVVRDDFLMACHGFEALRPVFSDLTPLGPPRGLALRRAIVQPALKCGYRFEDEGLVEEMLAASEGERGALPLLAFAAARLWEKRDRDLLWEGGSRGELELWRERYVGGLSRGEQELVDAVTRRARRRRGRRWALGAAFLVLALLAAVAILWR